MKELITRNFENTEVIFKEENGRTIYDRKWTGIGRDFILGLFKF